MINRDRATDYVTGVLSAAERADVERDAASDPELAREIARVSAELSVLLHEAPEVEPPADMFDRIKAAIAAGDAPKAAATGASRTVRAAEGKWEPFVPGIERKVLSFDRVRKRVTLLI